MKTGVNLLGVMANTLDAEIQLMIIPAVSITLSAGRQFGADVPEIINTENGKASGNFIRTGLILYTNSPDDRGSFFLRADFIYASLKHTTTVNFIDYYGPFDVYYESISKHSGFSFGLGVMAKISNKLEMEFYPALTFTSNNKPFMLKGYPLPGFYHGVRILEKEKPTNTFMKMCLNLKYRFNLTKNKLEPNEKFN